MDQHSSLTVPEALEKLATHGTAHQIAAHLEQQNVVGRRSRASSCVIAEYVRGQTNALVVEVHPRGNICDCSTCVGVGTVGWVGPDGLSAEVAIPEEINLLAAWFDRGYYPQLEAKK